MTDDLGPEVYGLALFIDRMREMPAPIGQKGEEMYTEREREIWKRAWNTFCFDGAAFCLLADSDLNYKNASEDERLGARRVIATWVDFMEEAGMFREAEGVDNG